MPLHDVQLSKWLMLARPVPRYYLQHIVQYNLGFCLFQYILASNTYLTSVAHLQVGKPESNVGKSCRCWLIIMYDTFVNPMYLFSLHNIGR